MGSSRGASLMVVLAIMMMAGMWLARGVEGQNNTTQQQQGLKLGFYANTCPAAESIVADSVRYAMLQNIGLAAGVLRMHFHDCFVRGCDGSVLIDSTETNTAEKDSARNKPSLRGFQVIDHAKTRLERVCPGVVSCADILAFAARDSVAFSGGLRYEVPSGRRDSRVSLASETFSNLPTSSFNLQELNRLFQSKGLSQSEMIALSGAHTIGRSHCGSFRNRLYRFNETFAQDPSMDSLYAVSLRSQCPGGADSSDASSVVPMDPRSPNTMDSSYYANILVKQGLLTSDQTLASSPSALTTVGNYAVHQDLWKENFAAAMVKMGQIGVLTGDDGEVRRNCRVVN